MELQPFFTAPNTARLTASNLELYWAAEQSFVAAPTR